LIFHDTKLKNKFNFARGIQQTPGKPVAHDSYKTISSQSQGSYKEKGSKFLAFAFPVGSEDEVKEKLTGLRKEYHDARHHCYAYRLGFDKSVYRINDDGEPSGTAGRPIYGQILSNDLTWVLIVVIRYFGGIKLGVPGLINAYKTAAKEALENAVIIQKDVHEVFLVSFEYLAMNNVMKALKEEDATILNQDFGNSCKIEFSVKKAFSGRISSRFSKMTNVLLELQRVT
jgi:uncharacterized YigZ family protein